MTETDYTIFLASAPGSDTPTVPEVSLDDLNRWTVEATIYSEKYKGMLDRLAGVVGLKAEYAQAGIIHEAKQFARFPDANDPTKLLEIGCSVRLLVATQQVDAEVSLSIPVVAASVEIQNRNARIAMEIAGYRGSLGTLLPSPAKLDVETCGVYLTAFQKIQAEVFAEENRSHLDPVLLGRTEGKTAEAALDVAARPSTSQ